MRCQYFRGNLSNAGSCSCRVRSEARVASVLRSRTVVRAQYDVEVDQGPSIPNAGPGRWSPPPPPPPPPPPQPQTSLPTRREALFGLLGLGVGVAGSAAYFTNTMFTEEEVADYYEVMTGEILDDMLRQEAISQVKELEEIEKALQTPEGQAVVKELAEKTFK